MGIYYNPPDGLKKVGRQLVPSDYAGLVDQLRPGEVLFGLYDRIIFKNAPHLNSQREMEEFEGQVRQGIIKGQGFYAVPKAMAVSGTGCEVDELTWPVG